METKEDAPKAAVFTIAGTEHEVPQVFALDMDEAQILYDYAKLTIEDFLPDDPGGEMSEERLEMIAERMKNPAFLRALRHIAYRRANRKDSEARIKAALGADNFAESYVEWVLSLGDEEGPPAQESTSTPTEQLPSDSVDSNGSSGSVSTNGSDHSDEILEPTGVTRSGTSSPQSDLLT